MKTDLFQSCGHCCLFQICWHIECSTFTASSFRIWNSSTGIPSPPLVMLPRHLTYMNIWKNDSQCVCVFGLQLIFIHYNEFICFYNGLSCNCCCSVAKLCPTLCDPTVAHQASLSFTVSRSLLNLMSLSWWCHPTVSSSVTLFSSCPQSFPAARSCPMSQLCASGGQVLDLQLQHQSFHWFPLGLTGLIFYIIKMLWNVYFL